MNLERSGFKVQQMLYDNSSGCLRYGKLVFHSFFFFRFSSFIIGLYSPIQNKNASSIRVSVKSSLSYHVICILYMNSCVLKLGDNL